MFRFNISQKFIGYLILIGFVPLLVVGITSYQISSSVLKDVASHYMLELVNRQANYIDLQLEQVESLLTNLSGVAEIRRVVETTNETPDTFTELSTQAQIGYILNGFSNLDGLVSIDIFTVDDRHFHVGDTLNVDNLRIDVRDRLFELTIANGDRVFWAGVEANVNVSSRHEQVLTAAKVLYRINRDTLAQEPLALVLVNYSLEHLYTDLNDVDFGDNAYMMIVDSFGRVIYHPNREQLGDYINADIAELRTLPEGSIVRRIDDADMSISIANSNLTDWQLISFIPVNTLLARTNEIQRAMLWVLLGCFLAVFLMSWVFNQNIVVPIREITRKYQQMQRGHVIDPVAVYGNDEITELSQWFNTFITIQQRQNEIEVALRESLENTELLYQSSRDLIAIRKLKGVMQLVVDNLIIALSADRAVLFLVDMEKAEITGFAKAGPGQDKVADVEFDELSQGLTGWVLKHDEPVFSVKDIPDPRESDDVQARRVVTQAGSIIVVPLSYQGRTLGTVTVINNPEDPDFTDEDINLVSTISNQAVVAIQNARLLQSLLESEEKFYTAFHASPDPMMISSLVDQRFIDVNTSFLQLLGYRREDVIGVSGTDLQLWMDLDNQQEFISLLHDSVDLRNFEAQLINKSGDLITDCLLSAEIIELNGETAYLTIVKDMTEHKKIAQQRLQIAVERERIDVLSKFINEASHEFRTPLSIISTNAYLLGRTDLHEPNLRLDAIKEQVTVIATLVDSLNLMATIDNNHEGVLSQIDVNDVLRSIYYLVLAETEAKQLDCKLELPDTPVIVLADASYLGKAFEHLWRNAIQYTAKGIIRVRAFEVDAQLIVELTDTGIGISDSDLPYIFNRFYQSDKAGTHRGFGLGLSIAKAIITLYEGDIAIKTQAGEGTTVTVTLPLSS